MKERPIIFSAPMVRAILDGAKTQTRRIVEPQPRVIYAIHVDASLSTERIFRKGDQRIHCPYGQPGDRLWVRESWQVWTDHNQLKAAEIPDNARQRINYPADGNTWDARMRLGRWMPRWASRITLEITGVRVERLQDISDEDAIQEGIDRTNTSIPGYARERFMHLWDSIHSGRPKLPSNPNSKRYARVKKWLDEHPDTTSWEANPFVWVIEFKRI